MKVIAEKMLPARLLCRLIPRVVPRTSTACLSTIPEPELKPLYLDAQVDLPPTTPFFRVVLISWMKHSDMDAKENLIASR